MQNLTTLFLSQSYDDTWEDYKRSINNDNFPVFDYIILTASNENQADGYRKQIDIRKKYLPKKTHFAVIPDEDGVRVGSGGATLSVLKYIYEREEKLIGKGHFDNLRILVIHSGGDSKRVPMYSALGKLFSPVPHKLFDGRSATLFDELMASMSSVATRIREGMVVLSGDVLLLFNPLQIDFSGRGAAAISFKENVETGKNHGVFLNGENNNVRKFLHKQTVETLKAVGAVNDRECVDIDTGAIIFAPDILKSLYSLVDTDESYKKYVNSKTRLSLYGDFLYPLASDSTLEQFYNEKPEGEFNDELYNARTIIWEKLHGFNLKLLRLSPAKFIHFGTTCEILKLMSSGVDNYNVIGWSRKTNSSTNGDIASYNSVLSDKANIGKNCYLESSIVHEDVTIGNNVIISYLDIYNVSIPNNVVLHGLRQKNGKYICRIYGIDDNPKESKLFGLDLNEIISNAGLNIDEIWDSDDHSLWNARLYPECDSQAEAIDWALKLYELCNNKRQLGEWHNINNKSLASGFNDADVSDILNFDTAMRELVSMEGILNNVKLRCSVKRVNKNKPLTEIQEKWLRYQLSNNDFSDNIRLLYYIGQVLGENEGNKYVSESLRLISSKIKNSAKQEIAYNDSCKIEKDECIVKLPLRVNFGGGWSDTPPICNELGGAVLNAAISLDGKLPVEVRLVKIEEKKIVFESKDMDAFGEFTDIENLQNTGDPNDEFALQKACLLACGIIPEQGGNLDKILTRLGGGFEMHSEVMNVPKGSGLGTSSILSAACVKAIFEFMGIEYNDEKLYSNVLVMEQIMSTGGGWQDQVGGCVNGIKFITSEPGIKQVLNVEYVDVSDKTKQELNDRFCLIYTGQRRLARNILRNVIGRYLTSEKDSVYALNEIKKIALLMKKSLEKGDVDEFSVLLQKHWELSKMIDKECTNTLIEQIFASIEDYIDARFVCGAGGGGFIQVILKKGVTKTQIHKRLKDVFQDSPVDVWAVQFV